MKKNYITEEDIADTVAKLSTVTGKDLDKFVAKIPFYVKEKLFRISYRGDDYADEIINLYKSKGWLDKLEKEMDKAIKGRLYLTAEIKYGGVDYSPQVFKDYVKAMNAAERRYTNTTQNGIMLDQWRERFDVEISLAEDWLKESLDPSKIEYYGVKGDHRVWRYHGTNLYFYYDYSPESLQVVFA